MPARGALRCALPLLAAILLAGLSFPAHAAERVLLASGFSVDCVRHEPSGDRLRLVLPPSADDAADSADNYMEVASAAVVSIENVPDAPATPRREAANTTPATIPEQLSASAMQPLLARAGAQHRLDEDLLASIVRAESNGHTHAISRTGARGLMQLMPGTASELGVHDAFVPAQNIDGGSAYLDRLLTRYHDNIALALAAYNAGPAAVDRVHGVPPYRETRQYVARVIREFNRRKLAAAHLPTPAAPPATLRAELR